MPVVINEFEVVPEAAPAPAAASAGEPQPDGGGKARHEPPDLLRLLAEERARQERVRAT